jgi:hypothetical protein
MCACCIGGSKLRQFILCLTVFGAENFTWWQADIFSVVFIDHPAAAAVGNTDVIGGCEVGS